ncbi:deazaflavin-dependent oxidoreductase (nitroreductase family) [Agromyces terreus]|uniref:Deazaflavin-dependent oxidoreductase (Nitroreductase family) n=1 Tax=Agromyces terreus TaxID=424795 RepID=A0A9X2KG37_9MICO|nr:nitroreductase family deazaflavin-dependent oxidoreductase [Agromyces terreus]MCP2372432.1 deazaflavin-dependent oxidoreductase (nitroreductase family) [Agromyces terreus]
MDLGTAFLTTRWAVRAPIPIFRAGFGFLFAGRMLLLEHRGRTSGERRYVVLEAVEREAPDRVVVASGFGPHAQWYRNLRAEPRCGVSVGARTRVPARAELLDDEESARLLEAYAARHPKAFEMLERSISRATGSAHPQIPMVRLHLEPRR